MIRSVRASLIVIESFLALTAVGGGVGLIAGFGASPADLLAGSLFSSYLIPGLALLLAVGGTAAAAVVLLARKRARARMMTFLSAAGILAFETVEIFVIGSPEGVARNLQILCIITGILLCSLAFFLPRVNETAEAPHT